MNRKEKGGPWAAGVGRGSVSLIHVVRTVARSHCRAFRQGPRRGGCADGRLEWEEGQEQTWETRSEVPSAPALGREARGVICSAGIKMLQGRACCVTDECRDVSTQKKEKHV